jgi:hypothetical protein
MNLFKQSFAVGKWVLWNIRIFMRLRPLTTLTVIGFSASSRVTNVLAFFLPLKVILLAGSQGVPGNLGVVIGPEDKLDWIILLSIAAVSCYVSTLLFDALSERLAESASAGIVEGAHKLALDKKQRAQARKTYSRLTHAVAGIAFGVVGMTALAAINTPLFAALAGLFVAEFAFTALVLARWREVNPGRLQGFINDNLADYLNILSSINFLAAFFLILTPFLFGEEGNILLAVLAVVIVRRALPELEWAIRVVTDLYKKRDEIEPLIFRRRRFRAGESVEGSLVRELFNKASRQVLVQKHLAPLRPRLSGLEVCWQDIPPKEVYTFVVSCRSGDAGLREYFQLQAFPEGYAHLLRNEDLLFATAGRDELKAPREILRFREASFECRICEYGPGEALLLKRYRNILAGLLTDIWCYAPPQKLVDAFNTAHDMLPGRLTSEMLDRLGVAADSAAENAALETLRRRLPEVRARLEALPLYIFNPDINSANVAEIEPGGFRVMTWAHWAIEPVGAGIPRELARGVLPELVKQVNSRRKDLARELTLQDVEFAELCWNFEKAVERDLYKGALAIASQIAGRLTGG